LKFSFAVFLLSVTCISFSQIPVQAVRVSESPVVEGIPDDGIWKFSPGSMFFFMIGENADPDELTGDYADPEFTVFSKLTWFLSV